MKTLLVPMVMLSLVVLASDLWAVTPPAKIAYVEGAVWIKKKGDDKPVPAELGQSLFYGDQVKTLGGKCQVNMTASGILRLSPNTTVLFPAEENRGDKISVMRMLKGKTEQNIENLWNDEVFEVRTPSLVAGTQDQPNPDAARVGYNAGGFTDGMINQPINPAPPIEKSGPDIVYHGVWLPEKYLPSGYRHYPDDKMPSGDPPQGNSSQSLWYGIPLQSKGGQSSSSSADHPYTVFIDGVTVFKSTATAKKYFKLYKDSYSEGTTAVALGDEAYAENEWFYKEYRSDDGTVFRRDVNLRNIRVGRVTVGLRINGGLVRDFDPNTSNSRRFTAYETPTRDDLMRVAEMFVGRVREYAKDKAWLEDELR